MEAFINYMFAVGYMVYNSAIWCYEYYPITTCVFGVVFLIWLFKPKKSKKKIEVKANKQQKIIYESNGITRYTNSEEYKLVKKKFIKEMSKQDLMDLFEDIVNERFKD